MIGKLTGVIDSCFDDHVIIDVGGVGYLVYCSMKTISSIRVNDACQLLIESHVREDHFHLYGFLFEEERYCFNLLKSVNGIGPRMALSILSQLDPEQIKSALNQEDKMLFRSVSGVGNKIAERIIVELKSKVSSILTKNNNSLVSNLVSDCTQGNMQIEAVSALVNLGINRIDAHNIISKIIKDREPQSISELIKLALKERG